MHAALNIMRLENKYRLIDLDASANFEKKQYAGAKLSSAYCPPEMFISDKMDDSGAPLKNNELEAHPSFDMWSLGATLYQVLKLKRRIIVSFQYVSF